MLQPRTLIASVRQTPLQRGLFTTAARSSGALPRLPQLGQHLSRSQQRTLSQAASRSWRTAADASALTRARQAPAATTWRSLSRKLSPLRTAFFRRSYASEAEKPASSVRDKFKELSRKYGWAAVGVYFGLSALDFPFCFLAVRLIGTDRIGEVEHKVADWFWNWVAVVAPSMRAQEREMVEEVDDMIDDVAADARKKKEEASIWTQLLLAYGLHKSLIFFRIPLTAAVTPKVVKTLRGWGWNIGPRVKKPKKVD